MSKCENAARMLPPLELLVEMLHSDTGDWEMVGSDGIGHRFHQTVLSAQVPYFRNLFTHPGTLEHASKLIFVSFPGESVLAFLRFFYYYDQTAMRRCFKTTCDLIRMGHLYNIPELVSVAAELLTPGGLRFSRPEDYFCVEDFGKLYQHVWLWEEDHPSKKTGYFETASGKQQ